MRIARDRSDSIRLLRSIARALFVAAPVVVLGTISMTAATTLLVGFTTPVVTCAVDGGSVSAGYTVTSSTAQGATVTETLTLNGNTVATDSYPIAAGSVSTGGGWAIAGQTKTHDATFNASGLANGSYSLEICVVQAGSAGNLAKTACSSETIVVNCATTVENPCANDVFGEVVGNKHISVNATAQINFRGDFGESANLTITGPNGFSASTVVDVDGNSCNYHANWKFTNGSGADIYGNDGPGTYTLVVTGNGNTLSFSAELTDK